MSAIVIITGIMVTGLDYGLMSRNWGASVGVGRCACGG